MSLNSNPSLLDGPQIIKRVFDASNDCMRVSIGDVNGLAFSLTASGDTIGIQGVSSSTKSSIDNTNTGTELGPISVVGMKTFNIFTNTTSTIVGAQTLTLQISPSDTDNVWISTSLTVTPSTVSGTVVMGTPLTTIARRARVITAAAITSGTYDIYLVVQGN